MPSSSIKLPTAAELREMHDQIHDLDSLVAPGKTARPKLSAEMEKATRLIPKLAEMVLDQSDNVRWFAGHLLWHLRDLGGREAFESRHQISIDLFATGGWGNVILENGKLVENPKAHGWCGH